MEDKALRMLMQPARWYRYFTQGKHWVPNGKPPVEIAEMDQAWRYNCVRYLERNAARYAEMFAQGCSSEELALGVFYPDMGEMARESVENDLWNQAAHAKRDPVVWIKTTALYLALAKDLPPGGRPMRKLAEKARHWGECDKRQRPKRGTCTCAELAARSRREQERRAAAVTDEAASFQ